MSRVLQIVFVIIVGIFGLAFYVRNKHEVILNYFTGTVSVDLALIVVGAFGVGGIAGVLVMVARVARLKRELKRLSHKNKVINRELSSLRAIPINDAS